MEKAGAEGHVGVPRPARLPAQNGTSAKRVHGGGPGQRFVAASAPYAARGNACVSPALGGGELPFFRAKPGVAFSPRHGEAKCREEKVKEGSR